MSKNIEIIPAKISNAEDLGKLHSRAFRKAYREIIPKEKLNSFTPEARSKSFAEALAAKEENTYISILDNTIVGFVTLGECRDSDIDNAGEIWGIYLDPDFQRQGIGTKLANWAIDYLAKSGFNKIILWVFKENSQSRKFYKSLGFIPDGNEKLIESCNAKAVRYIKYLK